MPVENFRTTREVAKLVGVSVRTIQLWVDQGLLKGWKTDGGHRRISEASVQELLRQRHDHAAAREYVLPILIVEDDPALLKLYRMQIATWPFPVDIFTAPNGYEGLVMVGEIAPALLVCDLRLPGVSGFQIVRYLSQIKRYAGMATVVVSGLAHEEIEAHGSLPEKVEVIGKPLDFARLRKIAHQTWIRRQDAASFDRDHARLR
jgi:excisionase family DNA binding protein